LTDNFARKNPLGRKGYQKKRNVCVAFAWGPELKVAGQGNGEGEKNEFNLERR